MSRVCDVCGKRPRMGEMYKRRGLAKRKGGVGRRITGKTRRRFMPNLQSVRAKVSGTVRRIRVCAQCIRSGKVTKTA